MPKKPKLVWVRERCPHCGAATKAEAEEKCAPVIHCPASPFVDRKGYLVQMTNESFKAWEAYQESKAS